MRSRPVRLSCDGGEAEGVCGLSWSTLKVSAPDWIQHNLINVLLQTDSKPQADWPNVPRSIIRRAFDATLKDPLFLADAKKALLEI